MPNVYSGELPKAVADRLYPLAVQRLTVILRCGNLLSKDATSVEVEAERQRLRNIAVQAAIHSYESDGQDPEGTRVTIYGKKPITGLEWLADFNISSDRLGLCPDNELRDRRFFEGMVDVECIGYRFKV